MKTSELSKLRNDYHKSLLKSILGYRKDKNKAAVPMPSIADRSSRASTEISQIIITKLQSATGQKPCLAPEGQTAGSSFANITKDYLESCFKLLNHLRPGTFKFSASQGGMNIANFDQYEHLAKLAVYLDANPELKTTLGQDYLITPDIVVSKESFSEKEINAKAHLLDSNLNTARLTANRTANFTEAVATLHASVSCKWTMRSDRAQNSRTEALNLIRNRKGRTPHIVAVTFEPLPTRLASIAMGTGDIDCTYHGALHELLIASEEGGFEDQSDLLQTLIMGRRLLDISDLPMDLIG